MNLLPFLVHNIWTNRTGQVPPSPAALEQIAAPVTVPAVCLMTCDEPGAMNAEGSNAKQATWDMFN